MFFCVFNKKGLDSIDENSMTYAADIFFAQTWKDHRLRLPENMSTEYRLIEVDWLKNMWRPDSWVLIECKAQHFDSWKNDISSDILTIWEPNYFWFWIYFGSFFKNAKSVTFQTMTIPNHYIWMYRDKTILYMVKLTLRLSCAMNFAIYPHDTQECKLQMESCKCLPLLCISLLSLNYIRKLMRLQFFSSSILMTWLDDESILICFIAARSHQCLTPQMTWFFNGIQVFHWLSMIILSCHN